MTILDSRAVRYARWCVQHDNPKAPHYVKLQAAQWLDIAEGRNTEALIDEKAYKRICKLLRLMIHPDLNCPINNTIGTIRCPPDMFFTLSQYSLFIFKSR